MFRVSSFLFALCYLIFSSFFFLLSDLDLLHKLCIRRRRQRHRRRKCSRGKNWNYSTWRDIWRRSHAASRSKARASGLCAGQGEWSMRGPGRVVYAGSQGERFMLGVKASDHAAGSSVIMALRTKKNHRLDAERSALKSSPRLLVEIALCSEQNARRRSRGHTVGQTLKARVQRARQSHSGAKRSSLH